MSDQSTRSGGPAYTRINIWGPGARSRSGGQKSGSVPSALRLLCASRAVRGDPKQASQRSARRASARAFGNRRQRHRRRCLPPPATCEAGAGVGRAPGRCAVSAAALGAANAATRSRTFSATCKPLSTASCHDGHDCTGFERARRSNVKAKQKTNPTR